MVIMENPSIGIKKKPHENPTHCWHTEGLVLLTIPTDVFSKYANLMRVPCVFASGVGGRRLNNCTEARKRLTSSIAGNLWLISKENILSTTEMHRRQRPRLALSNMALLLSLLQRD